MTTSTAGLPLFYRPPPCRAIYKLNFCVTLREYSNRNQIELTPCIYMRAINLWLVIKQLLQTGFFGTYYMGA